MLLELKEPINDIKPICLPNKSFRDYGVHATIAGYGKFKRSLCEVDGRGPSKYRYCGVEPDCKPGTYEYENNECKIQFNYKVCLFKKIYMPQLRITNIKPSFIINILELSKFLFHS